MVTLDVLSQYIGHRNYMEFTHWLKTSTKYNSSFFKANQLVSSDLQEGSLLFLSVGVPTVCCNSAIWATVPMK